MATENVTPRPADGWKGYTEQEYGAWAARASRLWSSLPGHRWKDVEAITAAFVALIREERERATERAAGDGAGGYVSPFDLLREGGKWLGAARSWLQWNKHNGSDVTWGSSDKLRPAMTVKDVEELAAHVAAAVMSKPAAVTPAELARLRGIERAAGELVAAWRDENRRAIWAEALEAALSPGAGREGT